jgi:hypothetical protein
VALSVENEPSLTIDSEELAPSPFRVFPRTERSVFPGSKRGRICLHMAVVRLDLGFRRSEGDSIMHTHVGDKFMALEIVWRNPVALARADRTLRRIRNDRLGALYAVTNVALVQWYELVRGDAA